jgi:hypothetical protein
MPPSKSASRRRWCIAARTGRHYLPKQLRPLSIVRTDSCLVASAARLRYEIPISQATGSAQRGFLKGRSMLLNVLLVDTRLRTGLAESDRAGAVFLTSKLSFLHWPTATCTQLWTS